MLTGEATIRAKTGNKDERVGTFAKGEGTVQNGDFFQS